MGTYIIERSQIFPNEIQSSSDLKTVKFTDPLQHMEVFILNSFNFVFSSVSSHMENFYSLCQHMFCYIYTAELVTIK